MPWFCSCSEYYPPPTAAYAQSDTKLELNITYAGTLAAKVLQQVDNFDEVTSLKVTGVISEDDWFTIRYRMPKLTHVDLGEAKVVGNSFQFTNSNLGTPYATIKWLSLPQGVVNVYNLQCPSLEELYIPEGAKALGRISGSSAAKLTKVHLPKTLTLIDEYAFYESKMLEEVELPEGITTIGESAFSGCSKLKSLRLPSSLTTLGLYALYNTSIEDFDLSHTKLQTIGSYALGTKAKTVKLPSTVRYIEYSIFGGSSMSEITLYSMIPPRLTHNLTISSHAKPVIKVPALTADLYRNENYWKDAFDKEYAILEACEELNNGDLRIERSQTLSIDPRTAATYHPNLIIKGRQSKSEGYNSDAYLPSKLSINSPSLFSLSSLEMSYDVRSWYSPTQKADSYTYRAGVLYLDGQMSSDETKIDFYLNNRGYSYITLPFNVSLADVYCLSDPTARIEVYAFSGSKRADNLECHMNTWQLLGKNDVMEAGKGYAVMLNATGTSSSTVGVAFPARVDDKQQDIFTTTDQQMPLEENPAEFAHNSNWNCLGNPYPTYYDTRMLSLGAPITVWNEDKQVFNTYSPIDDGYILSPGEAFFIQRPADADVLRFGEQGRQMDFTVRDINNAVRAKALQSASPRQVWNLTLGDDRTRIVFNPEATADYEAGRDAAKFDTEAGGAIIYTLSGRTAYAINELPATDQPIQLGLRVPTTGEYSIQLDGPAPLLLTDTQTGTELMLEPGQPATIALEAGTWSQRYNVRRAQIAIADMNFINKQVTVGDCMYLLDKTNQLAAFSTLVDPAFEPEGGILHLPSQIEVDGVSYSVVALGNPKQSYANNKDYPGVKELDLPESMTVINSEYLAEFVNIRTLTLPKSFSHFVNSMKARLTRINFTNPEPTAMPDGYGNRISYCVISVPDGCKDAYITALAKWSGNHSKYIIVEGDKYVTNQNAFSLTVSAPGKLTDELKSYIGDVKDINQLTLYGQINNSDFNTIKQCTDLRRLDLSNVQIAPGTYKQALLNMRYLEYLALPDVIKTLYDGMLSGCWSLSQIEMNPVYEEIGANAFSYCESLKSFSVPATCTTIGKGAFSGCATLKSISLPASVTTLGSSAFENCLALADIQLPASITQLPDNLLSGCSSLHSVRLSGQLQSIGSYTFAKCASLTTLTCGDEEATPDCIKLPGTLETINPYAFSACAAIKEVQFNEGLQTIDHDAFANCSSLTDIQLPATLTSLGYGAFHDCENLVKADMEATQITAMQRTFYQCKNFSEVSLPHALLKLDEAFYGCALEDITLPETVFELDYPFIGCSKLKTIRSKAFFPPNIASSLQGITVYVPALALSTYRLHDTWSQAAALLPLDYQPGVINLAIPTVFASRESLPAGYKPELNLVSPHTTNNNKFVCDMGVEHSNFSGRLVTEPGTDLDLSAFSMELSTRVVDTYCTALINRSKVTADKASATIHVYRSNLTSNGEKRWQFISLPFDVKFSDITPNMAPRNGLCAPTTVRHVPQRVRPAAGRRSAVPTYSRQVRDTPSTSRPRQPHRSTTSWLVPTGTRRWNCLRETSHWMSWPILQSCPPMPVGTSWPIPTPASSTPA